MEFKLEGILETLLVGSIVSLLLLSVLFFFFGHVLRITPIRKFFSFLLTDNHKLREPADKRRDEWAEAVSHGGRHGSEGGDHANFFVIVMLAVLYGLGVMTESLSHVVMAEADSRVKLEAFEFVGMGQLTSGTNANKLLDQFIADFEACKARGYEYPRAATRSCGQINDRVLEYYHNAKNLVFQNEGFRSELMSLESRIDFARSLFGVLVCLVVSFVLMSAVAGVFEYLWTRRRHYDGTRRRRIYDEHPWLQDITHHWVNLAAARCALIAVGLGLFTYLSWLARRESEKQFDKRVFGYALSLQAGRVSAEHEGGEPARSKDVTPPSPYHVFALRSEKFSPEQFEPSAVQALDNSSHLLVVNEKGGTQTFVAFDRTSESKLVNPRAVEAVDGKLAHFFVGPGGARDDVKSLCAARTLGEADTDDAAIVGATEVYAASSAGRIMSFVVDLNGEPKAENLKEYTAASPCEVFKRGDRQPSCAVEGMALRRDRDDLHLLLGIRFVDGTPTVAIVRLTLKGGAWVHPTLVFRVDPDLVQDDCGHKSGTSDLAEGPDGLYMLTSVELQDDDKPCGRPADRKQSLPEVAQVGGALWQIPDKWIYPIENDAFTPLDGTLVPIEAFVHRPAGIADLNDGSLMVVFDDEGRRKSPSRAPSTFALEQAESVFAIVRAPPVGEAPSGR